jgi:hypothetical protein
LHHHQGNAGLHLWISLWPYLQKARVALEYGCSGGAVVLETRMGSKHAQGVPEN